MPKSSINRNSLDAAEIEWLLALLKSVLKEEEVFAVATFAFSPVWNLFVSIEATSLGFMQTQPLGRLDGMLIFLFLRRALRREILCDPWNGIAQFSRVCWWCRHNKRNSCNTFTHRMLVSEGTGKRSFSPGMVQISCNSQLNCRHMGLWSLSRPCEAGWDWLTMSAPGNRRAPVMAQYVLPICFPWLEPI